MLEIIIRLILWTIFMIINIYCRLKYKKKYPLICFIIIAMMGGWILGRFLLC